MYLRPSRHLDRKTDEQENSTHQGGIEWILPQTAKGHLANANGKESANDDNPKGKITWQVKAQQKTCKDGAAIANSAYVSAKNKFCNGPLKEYAGDHRCGKHYGRP
jgi:hypothetical protein